MIRVTAAPTVKQLATRRYAKSYNLLSNFAADDIRIDAYVGRKLFDLPDDTPLPGARNVYVHELGHGDPVRYLPAALREADRRIRRGRVDVYMHMNLDYRWFNPLALTGRTRDVPFVIGPSQAGHSVKREEFKRMVGRLPGPELPPSVADVAYDVVDPLKHTLLDPVRMTLFERTLQAADRIAVVHEDARRVYEEFVDPSRLTVIPLGVSPDEFSFTERTDSHEVVAIGSLRERKGYDVLLDALAMVREEVPEVSLHVFGDGPLESDLKRRAERLGVRDHVTFHGFVDQSVVRDHLQRARLFVHPSRSESFSLVRLEAMSTGCPVVISDIPGAHEMVSDGEEGFVVPTEDADALAASMCRILTDADFARELGYNAREKVERRYDWREIGQQYLDVVRQVA
jgi:glycosyltransferase involved in cell wall biosynthesis